MKNIRYRWIFLLVPVFLFGLYSSASLEIHRPENNEAKRSRLSSYIIRKSLVSYHYSHKKLDNSLSRDAFSLFIKQLDFQKRFLLDLDVKRLEAYALLIDDEMNSGRIELPAEAYAIMKTRYAEAGNIVHELMQGEFDFYKNEGLETDAEIISYCGTRDCLRDRWRKILKYQITTRFIDLLEEQQAKANDSQKTAGDGGDLLTEKELIAKAKEKVLKSQEDFLSRLSRDEEREYFDRYFNAVARAFDPHTNYLPPAVKEDFDISMRGSLEGIGATLREENGYIKVVRIIPGSAAYRQGKLQAEDVILKVAEGSGEPVDLIDMPIRDAVSYIRGPKGTEVRLHVKKPDAKRIIIPVIRDIVQIEETFVKSTVLDGDNGKRYGYIRIPSFYRDFGDGNGRNSSKDVLAALTSLQQEKIDGIVLDLWNNGGGALTDAVEITGMFVRTGPVVQVRNSNGSINMLKDEDPTIVYGGPLVVLVNKFSASASEILAGALQDYGRAVIAGGEHTHGKGTVQTVLDLDRHTPLLGMDKYKPLGALKITIQKFYRISGESTQYRGIVPDVILPDKFKYMKSSEQHLDFSLPWDTVAPAVYEKWQQQPAIDIADLRQKSAERVKTIREFARINERAELSKERQQDTLQSLNIEDIRKDLKHFDFNDEEDSDPENPHDTVPVDEPATNDSGMDGEKRPDHWRQNVLKNPYVQEAMHILADIPR